MATGLASFDAFSWASLLKDRPILVVDRDRARGRSIAGALEDAGAVATLAPNQALAADRAAEAPFRHIVLSLSDGETPSPSFAAALLRLSRAAILLADPGRHAELRSALPSARIGDRTLDARSLVLFLLETPDE